MPVDEKDAELIKGNFKKYGLSPYIFNNFADK